MTRDFENFNPTVTRLSGQPYRTWFTQELACAAYPTWYGGLNGYVRLPISHPDLVFARTAEDVANVESGYDYVSVPVHGGWTYGPDLEGWIGFDTMHWQDRWDIETRRRLVPEEARDELEFLLEFEARHPRPLSVLGSYLWTEQLLIDETSRAAEGLAALIKETDLHRS